MPEFEFDLKKLEWPAPKIPELVARIGKAFETTVSLKELNFYCTDHIERHRIKEDEDIVTFMKKTSKSRLNEKLVKTKLPEWVVPPSWQPKKMDILVKGQLVSKFFGDEPVSTRQVEFTLKFFDCGHFRLKQALPGSGASPYWVIFEGRWVQYSKGFKLQFLFRYPWQNSKRGMFEFAIEAVPDKHEFTLAFEGEGESQINGMMPAIVGEDATCWVELCREGDVYNVPAARFNEEEEEEAFPQQDARPHEDKPTEAQVPPRSSASASASSSAPAEGPFPGPPAADTSTPSASKPPEPEEEYKDPVPIWPMYICLALFVALLLFFGYLWWEERTVPIGAPPEFDEL